MKLIVLQIIKGVDRKMTKDELKCELINKIIEMDENTFNDFLSLAKQMIDDESSEQES